MDIIHLRDIQNILSESHLQLNSDFLTALLKSASKSDFPHKEKKFIENIGCTYNSNTWTSTTVSGWLNSYRTIPFKKLQIIVPLSNYRWEDVESNIISIKAGIRKGEIYPKFPINVGKDLGSIIGYILGDGTLDKKYSQIAFYNTDPVLLNDFAASMMALFGIKPRVWIQSKKKKLTEKSIWIKRVRNIESVPANVNIALFYPRICGLIIKGIAGNFAHGRQKRITEEIKKHNLEFQRAVIRAFFDSEAATYNHRNMIRVFQNDVIMLEDIKKMLLCFNIKTNRVRTYTKQNKPHSLFDITNKENFVKFHKEIGFLSSQKKLNSL